MCSVTAGPVAPAGQPGQYARMPACDLVALLPYGLSPDGRLMHVAEVPAGLACWCRCPCCGSPLVARKGALVAPHFAHAGGRTCKAAWETTLHRLAKEEVCAARELLLPEAVAELDGVREPVAAAQVFRCEAVETEVDLGGLRPDALLHRAGRTLAVEFAVTHFCEPEKVAELRRRELPCVEVDLSAVPRLATREAHTHAILHEAPRRWLFNARIIQAEARLRAAGQARAEAERARQAGQHARLTEAVVAAWASPHRPGDPAWVRWAHDAGLGEIVGVPVAGQEVFAVEPAAWQAVLLQLYMTGSGKGRVEAGQVLQGLRERGALKAPFAAARAWDSDLVGQVRARLPDFQPPAEVVSTYCAHLVGCGVFRLGAGGWRADPDTAEDVRARLAAARSARAASVLYPLDAAFGAVVDREVDGPGALPAQLEANPSRRISQARAATRAARAVFLCSAPCVGQPNAGVTGQSLRLACAEPGDQLAVFGEAVRELSERAAYLYEETGRHWFATQPTLNRLADDRAKDLPEHVVDSAVVAVLKEDAGAKGGFHRVFAAPDDPAAVDEAEAASLLILAPDTTHAGRGVAASPAVEAATDALTRCRGGQRGFRNTLIFVAPDESGLANAREVVRKSLAWAGITADKRLRAQMTGGQVADAEEKERSFKDAARKAVRTAWSHVLYPVRSDTPGKAFALEHAPITARERGAVPATVYDKVRNDGIVSERLGGESLWHALKDIWPEDRAHLPVAEMAEWFGRYVYLPRLRDRAVLDAAVRDAAGKLDPRFGWAEAVEADGSAYRGLLWGKAPPEVFPASAVLVRAAEAKAQVAAAAQERQGEPRSGAHPSPDMAEVVFVDPPPPHAQQPRRFYGSVELDPMRPVKALDAIINAVVMELQRTPGTKVRLTLEIEANAPDGFEEAEIGVVRDNARQLRFKPEATGFDD